MILPIWLDVSKEDIMQYSPSLADLYAVKASAGISEAVRELLKAIKPQGSSLLVARDILIEAGLHPPVVTDDWWHRAIDYCGSNPEEDTFQEAMGWGRWGFPLPRRGNTAMENGRRIAFAVMQVNWQDIAVKKRISQVSHPSVVLDFIKVTPGLTEACLSHPHYLAAYAPQLTIRGFGEDFESVFDELLQWSRQRQAELLAQSPRCGTGLTIDGTVPTCDELFALCDPEFGRYDPAIIACHFVQGEAINGPPVKVYEFIDYIAWLLSSKSSWMPEMTRAFLTQGMKEWAVWPWHQHTHPQDEFDFVSNDATGSLLDSLCRRRTPSSFVLTKAIRQDISSRLEHSRCILDLPETGDELTGLFLAKDFIGAWIIENNERRKRNRA